MILLIDDEAFKIPPIHEHLKGSNISFEESGEFSKSETWTQLLKESSPTRGVKARPKVKIIGQKRKMKDSFTKMKTTPLLSPVMESELLREIWPPVKNCQNSVFKKSIAPSWEENYQDLSVYCVDQSSGNWSRRQPPSQRQQDYRIGEQNTSKISSVGYSNDYSSYKDSRFESSSGTGDNWTASNNIDSAVMSSEGSLPLGQDQFDTGIDITSDDLFSFLTTTNINEQQTIDSLQLIPNSNRSITDSNFDPICNNIEPGFLDTFALNPQDIDTIQFDDSLTNNVWDDSCMILNNNPSISTNATDQQYEQKSLPTDEPLANFTENDSFNIISYIEEENRNLLGKQSIAEKEEFTASEIVAPSEILNTNKRRAYRKRKSSEITTTEIEPYVPPLRINIKTKTISPKKRRSSKLLSEESTSYIDSDSDTRTSDYNYKELREKNNEASRKSRINKKVKETEMMKREKELEKENNILKLRVEELEKSVNYMRTAMLQSVLKKEP